VIDFKSSTDGQEDGAPNGASFETDGEPELVWHQEHDQKDDTTEAAPPVGSSMNDAVLAAIAAAEKEAQIQLREQKKERERDGPKSKTKKSKKEKSKVKKSRKKSTKQAETL